MAVFSSYMAPALHSRCTVTAPPSALSHLFSHSLLSVFHLVDSKVQSNAMWPSVWMGWEWAKQISARKGWCRSHTPPVSILHSHIPVKYPSLHTLGFGLIMENHPFRFTATSLSLTFLIHSYVRYAVRQQTKTVKVYLVRPQEIYDTIHIWMAIPVLEA